MSRGSLRWCVPTLPPPFPPLVDRVLIIRRQETAKDAIRNKRKRKNDDKGDGEEREAPSKFNRKSSGKKVSFA